MIFNPSLALLSGIFHLSFDNLRENIKITTLKKDAQEDLLAPVHREALTTVV